MRQTITQSLPDDDRSIAGQITRALAGRIISGALEPGTPLRQDHIAEEFRSSHVPVREAFQRLEAQGLVTREPRKGVRVTAIEPASVFEITEMRAALETLALRHAAPRITTTTIETAARTLDADNASENIMTWEAANQAFHRTILQPCGMPRLLENIDQLQRMSARFLFATWQRLDWQHHSDEEHRAIIIALSRREVEEAERILRLHILQAGQALVAYLTNHQNSMPRES